MNYKKITEDIFLPETTSPNPIILSELVAERDRLVAAQNQTEPTDEELIELGRMMHPYYMDRINADVEIERLTALITELEAL